MTHVFNGMPATDLGDLPWQKSPTSSPAGNCVEMAALPTGEIALRNSRHPDGPALIFTNAEIRHLLLGAAAGHFDNLLETD
jgi:Domain of unknown function (DUF397)